MFSEIAIGNHSQDAPAAINKPPPALSKRMNGIDRYQEDLAPRQFELARQFMTNEHPPKQDHTFEMDQGFPNGHVPGLVTDIERLAITKNHVYPQPFEAGETSVKQKKAAALNPLRLHKVEQHITPPSTVAKSSAGTNFKVPGGREQSPRQQESSRAGPRYSSSFCTETSPSLPRSTSPTAERVKQYTHPGLPVKKETIPNHSTITLPHRHGKPEFDGHCRSSDKKETKGEADNSRASGSDNVFFRDGETPFSPSDLVAPLRLKSFSSAQPITRSGSKVGCEPFEVCIVSSVVAVLCVLDRFGVQTIRITQNLSLRYGSSSVLVFSEFDCIDHEPVYTSSPSRSSSSQVC